MAINGDVAYKFKKIAAVTSSISGSRYFLSGSRTSSTLVSLYENGSLLLNTTTPDSGSIPTPKMCTGAVCDTDTAATDYGSLTDKFTCWGGGLTAAQHLTLHDLVQAYQASLGRSSA